MDRSRSHHAAPMKDHEHRAPAPAIPDEEIAARAYLLWIARGSPHDDDGHDWFAALDELRRERLARRRN